MKIHRQQPNHPKLWLLSLWLAARKSGAFAIWSVNLENGTVGQVLGICGKDLAFDGRWVWATQNDVVLAVDPETGQVMAFATVQGTPTEITSNGKNQIWLLANLGNDTLLQTLKTR